MLKKFAAVCAVVVLVACGGGTSVTGPSPDQQPVVSTPVAQPAATPVPVAAPPATGPSFEGYITPNGGWYVKNLSTNISRFTAYYTSFDNQTLSLGSKTVDRNPGDTWEDSFNKTCIQVDLTYGAPGDTPFLAGFINHKGQVVRANEIDRAACAPACVPEYSKRTATTYEGQGCTRKRVVTTYTTNSCTNAVTESVEKFDDAEPVYRTDGYFQIDSLSHAGNLYSITDSGLPGLGVWQFPLTLPAGNNLGIRYAHAVNGKKLTLWYLLEKIGSAEATCPTEGTSADWHGKVSFQCKRVNTCERQ